MLHLEEGGNMSGNVTGFFQGLIFCILYGSLKFKKSWDETRNIKIFVVIDTSCLLHLLFRPWKTRQISRQNVKKQTNKYEDHTMFLWSMCRIRNICQVIKKSLSQKLLAKKLSAVQFLTKIAMRYANIFYLFFEQNWLF